MREAIWFALLQSARWTRYYGVLTSRFRRIELAVRFVLVGSALTSITAFFAEVPRGVQLAAGVVVGIAVVIDAVVQPTRTATTLAFIRDECARLRLSLDDLWRQASTLEDDEARRLLTELNANLHHVTTKDPTTESDKINKKTTQAVFDHVEDSGYVC